MCSATHFTLKTPSTLTSTIAREPMSEMLAGWITPARSHGGVNRANASDCCMKLKNAFRCRTNDALLYKLH